MENLQTLPRILILMNSHPKNIIRQKRTANYTVIPNDIFNNPKLSFKAKGILNYLLSKPDNWSVYLSQIAKASTEGYDAVVSGMNELIEQRYVFRRPICGVNPGGWEYFVYDEPQVDDPFPLGESPTRDFPESGKSTTTKETTNKVSNDITNKEDENFTEKDQTASFESTFSQNNKIYNEAFEKFWAVYPRKIAKKNAYREWNRCKVDLPTALKAIEQQRAKGLFKEEKFIPYPERWIKNGRWEECETAPQPASKPAGLAGGIAGREDEFWAWVHSKRPWEERRPTRAVPEEWVWDFLNGTKDEDLF
jgi:hypothetical protein